MYEKRCKSRINKGRDFKFFLGTMGVLLLLLLGDIVWSFVN